MSIDSKHRPSAAGRPGRIAASPRARRLMRSLQLDPTAVAGSGPGGRIVEADVRRAQTQTAPRPATGLASTMRRAVARLTTASAQVPQFSVNAEIDALHLVSLRQQLIQTIESECGVRLSFTDLILRAQALALAETPAARHVWRDDDLQSVPTVDLGLVVNAAGGLLIPIIPAVDRLSLAELARQRHDLAAAARAGRLPAERLGGGLSSLSNLGQSRVDDFNALLAPPQSSILAVGRLADRPWAIDGQLVVRPTLRLSLSVDHRVLDGVQAAELLGRIVLRLEQPALLIYS